jgi:hypothetical protein
MTRSLPPTAPSHETESARPLANDPPPSGADLVPWPGLLDDGCYEVLIPGADALSSEELDRADQGGPWPIQIRFPSVASAFRSGVSAQFAGDLALLANGDVQQGLRLIEALGRAARGESHTPRPERPSSPPGRYLKLRDYGAHRGVSVGTLRKWLRLGLQLGSDFAETGRTPRRTPWPSG